MLSGTGPKLGGMSFDRGISSCIGKGCRFGGADFDDADAEVDLVGAAVNGLE